MQDNKGHKAALISVVVLTYNSAAFVVETLESIKEQTYYNIELIVTDDCSTDNTVEVCKQWIENNIDRFVRSEVVTTSKNSGIPTNCNRGIFASTGEWIKFIAGDDALMPNLLTEYIQHINLNPDIEFLHSNVVHYNESLNEGNKDIQTDCAKLRMNEKGISSMEQYEILLRVNHVKAPTTFIKKTIFNKVGTFDERYPLWEDRPMWIKITENNIKLHFLDIVGVKYRVHCNSTQYNNKEKRLFSNYAIQHYKAYHENYLHRLPLTERFYKRIMIGRVFFLNEIDRKIGYSAASFLLKLTSFSHIKGLLK
jgi:glycosyltransferase involved in cell wall biosynthesis